MAQGHPSKLYTQLVKKLPVESEVLTTVKMTFFWIVTPCSLVRRYQHFGERWYLPVRIHCVTTQKKNVVKKFVVFTEPKRLLLWTLELSHLFFEDLSFDFHQLHNFSTYHLLLISSS
jgi:hypothetical protein